MGKRNIKVGYILAFVLGAFGIHAFYYGKYIRGLIYFGISIIFNSLIPLMVIVGWIDMFFIKKWHTPSDTDNNSASSSTKTVKENKNPQAKKWSLTEQNSFYITEENILNKYSNINTPKYIIESVRSVLKEKPETYKQGEIEFSVSFNTDDKRFIKDSVKYRNKFQDEAREIPLKEYWTTFQSLNDRQLKWYLNWRKQVLNKNYIDVDMSYIILFVYELINYTFNKNASFNISMMETLYNQYKERHPKLENYIPDWIADMLYELEENELAKYWDDDTAWTPKLYYAVEDKLPLDKISMNTWKECFTISRETAYFRENRSNVYSIFKTGMGLVGELYKNNEISLKEKWFDERQDRKIRRIFVSAVVGREREDIHVPITKIRPSKQLEQELISMLKLSENISRKLKGINRKVKVNEEFLVDDIKQRLEHHYLNQKSNQDQDFSERFREVNNKGTINIEGSKVPKQQEDTVDSRKTSIQFDGEKITKINDDLSELNHLFEEGAEEEASKQIINDLNQKIEWYEEDKNDIKSFISDLNETELTVIEFFENDLEIEKNIVENYIRERGIMWGVFITGLNEKANEYLGDVLIDITEYKLYFNEEYESVIKQLKERSINEN